MKVIIKQKNNTYEIEMDSEKDTVKQLKDKFQKMVGVEYESIKMIFSGTILNDLNTLDSYNIKDGNKLIILNLKPKKKEITKEVKMEKKKLEEEKPDYTAQIKNLIHLGYQKEIAEKVINQTKGDVNSAINILVNEKKESNSNNKKDNNTNNSNDKSSNNIIQKKKSEGNIDNSLSKELRKIGIIIKILTLKDASRINTILDTIKNGNPSLFNQIFDNEEKIEQFLGTPINESDFKIYVENYAEAKKLSGLSDKNKTEGKVDILLTLEESLMVNNLRKLGNFTIEQIIEAYITNNKNEEEAGKYLLNLDKNKNENNKDNIN